MAKKQIALALTLVLLVMTMAVGCTTATNTTNTTGQKDPDAVTTQDPANPATTPGTEAPAATGFTVSDIIRKQVTADIDHYHSNTFYQSLTADNLATFGDEIKSKQAALLEKAANDDEKYYVKKGYGVSYIAMLAHVMKFTNEAAKSSLASKDYLAAADRQANMAEWAETYSEDMIAADSREDLAGVPDIEEPYLSMYADLVAPK